MATSQLNWMQRVHTGQARGNRGTLEIRACYRESEDQCEGFLRMKPQLRCLPTCTKLPGASQSRKSFDERKKNFQQQKMVQFNFRPNLRAKWRHGFGCIGWPYPTFIENAVVFLTSHREVKSQGAEDKTHLRSVSMQINCFDFAGETMAVIKFFFSPNKLWKILTSDICDIVI